MTVDYTPSAAEIAAGGPMVLILSTTGNGVCPAAFDSLQIDFVAGPTVDAGPDTQVCRDTSSVQLNGSYTVAGGVVWSTTGSGTFTPDNTAPNTTYIPTASDTAAGCITFYLSTTFNANCVAVTDTMELCFYAPPAIAITANDTICTGQAITLSATTSTGSGYWSTSGDGNFAPDSLVTATSTPSYINGPGDASAGTVTFIFTSTNNGGCQEQRDTLDVGVVPSPQPSFTNDQVCFGQPTTFMNTSTAVGGISGYQWLNGGSPFSTATNPGFIFPTEGNQSVSLVVTSNNGCIDTVTQNVMVNYLPNVAFTNVTPCLQGGTPFDDNSTVTGSVVNAWEWHFGDGTTSFVQNPVHQYPNSGSYSVTLIATSAQGCVDSLTQPTFVLPAPTAAFTVDPHFANPFQTVNFTDHSSPVVSWEWNFGDGSGTSTSQHPSYAYNGSLVYNVMLVVTDTNGCRDTAIGEVIVFLPPQVPSGFSPNGSGANDILYVYGGPFTDMEFKVYNNWGEVVFTSNEQAIGWDGTYKGVPQPIGVFVYTLKATTPDGGLHEKSGDVTLLR
jgi:gliding motility-associated-like protein